MIKDRFTENELNLIQDRYCKSAQSFLQVKSGDVALLRDKIYDETSFLPSDIKFKIRLWHVLNDVDTLPKCNICGETYNTLNYDLKISSTPDIFPYSEHCVPHKKVWNTARFIEESKKLFDDQFDYFMVEYKGMVNKVKLRCIEHDLWFEQTPNNHLNTKVPCPECSNEIKRNKYRIDRDEWLAQFRDQWGGKYDYSKMIDPDNCRSRIVVICPTHGEWETDCFNHGNEGLGCPKCYYESEDRFISSGEQEVVDFVKGILPESIEVVTSDRDTLDGKELDIYIPDMDIAIEYNGVYWHSTAKKSDINYHLNKTKRAEKRGIRLLHIFSDEWEFRQEVVKEKIKSILGVSDKKRVYARKTKVRLSNNKEVEEFYEANHIQGHMINSSFVYVLEYGDEIVAAMSIKKINEDGEWDITRYATSCHVIGGFTKLLTAFKRDCPDWTKIISFADRRWSKGDLYLNNGFVEVHKARPDYQYVVGKQRVNKRKFRHNRLENVLDKYDPTLSEFQNMDKHGIHRVYDCGLIKFETTQ